MMFASRAVLGATPRARAGGASERANAGSERTTGVAPRRAVVATALRPLDTRQDNCSYCWFWRRNLHCCLGESFTTGFKEFVAVRLTCARMAAASAGTTVALLRQYGFLNLRKLKGMVKKGKKTSEAVVKTTRNPSNPLSMLFCYVNLNFYFFH